MRSKVALLQQTVELINEMRKGNQAEAGTPHSGAESVVMIRYRTLHDCRRWRWPLAGSRRRGGGHPSREPPTRIRAAAWLERYQESRQGPEQTEPFTETYKVGADGALDLSQIAGDVRVTTGRNNEIRIEAIKRVRHRDTDEAKRLLGAAARSRSRRSAIASRSARSIRAASGRGLSAESRLHHHRAANRRRSRSRRSPATCRSPACAAKCAPKRISGDVEVVAHAEPGRRQDRVGRRARHATSAPSTLTLGTVSGSVIATALKVRALDCRQRQRQRAALEPPGRAPDRQDRQRRHRLRRQPGARRPLRVQRALRQRPPRCSPTRTGFELDASTFSGSIRSDFPVTLRSTAGDDPRGRRGMINRAIRGTFGDASAILCDPQLLGHRRHHEEVRTVSFQLTVPVQSADSASKLSERLELATGTGTRAPRTGRASSTTTHDPPGAASPTAL